MLGGKDQLFSQLASLLLGVSLFIHSGLKMPYQRGRPPKGLKHSVPGVISPTRDPREIFDAKHRLYEKSRIN